MRLFVEILRGLEIEIIPRIDLDEDPFVEILRGLEMVCTISTTRCIALGFVEILRGLEIIINFAQSYSSLVFVEILRGLEIYIA